MCCYLQSLLSEFNLEQKKFEREQQRQKGKDTICHLCQHYSEPNFLLPSSFYPSFLSLLSIPPFYPSTLFSPPLLLCSLSPSSSSILPLPSSKLSLSLPPLSPPPPASSSPCLSVRRLHSTSLGGVS